MREAVDTSPCPRCQQPLAITQTPARPGAQLALDRLICPNCGAALVRDIEGHVDRGWRLDQTRLERFDTLELRVSIRRCAADYNEHWLLERHGYRTPRQARDALRQPAMA